MTDEGWDSFYQRFVSVAKAAKILAKYDPEMEAIVKASISDEVIGKNLEAFKTIEGAKKVLEENKDYLASVRAALLK